MGGEKVKRGRKGRTRVLYSTHIKGARTVYKCLVLVIYTAIILKDKINVI